ncbi:MAG: hypothetical protein ACXVH7_09800, partial [Thermoanaerobaculia bacterium]
MTVSRGFVCSLLGIGMTVFSWYGPWAWPAWPAFTVLHLVFGTGAAWQELPYGQRAAVVVVLIIINSGFWALLAAALWSMWSRTRRSTPPPTTQS